MNRVDLITKNEPVAVEDAKLTILDASKRERHFTEPFKSRKAKDRLYIFPEDWSVLSHLTGRWTSPVKQYRKLLPAVLEAAGLDPNIKCSWSQKAGCGCGCSPGFILESHSGNYGIYGADFYVTFRDDEAHEAKRLEEIKAQFATFLDA